MALGRLDSVTLAPVVSQALNIEVVEIMNKTEHIYTSTMRLHYKEHRRGGGGQGIHPSALYQGRGLHGLYVMAFFLACGFLLTVRWVGINGILVEVARAGLGKPSQRVKEPDDSVEKVQRTKEISTSACDLQPPVWAKGNGTTTWSIRVKRRRVEWPPGKGPPCKRG